MPFIWFMLFIILFSSKAKIYSYFKYLFIILFLLSLPIFIYFIEIPLNNGLNKFSNKDKISAVIVLTAGSYKDVNNNWHPSSKSIKRVALGDKISKELSVPLIISGGNKSKSLPAESLIVSRLIKNNMIILDKESMNTYESAINLEAILKTINLNKNNNYLLITSSLHNLRSSLTFKTQNYNVKTYNYKDLEDIDFYKFIPSSKSFMFLNYCLYEYYGIIKYIFLGYINII